MRIATVAVVTSAVTIAIGGMLAFCRAEEPADAQLKAESASPSSAAITPAEGPSAEPVLPATRRWGDPEPTPASPATVFAEELSAIRDRVGSVLPENWEAFGAPSAPVDRSEFVQSVETLEADASPQAVLTPIPGRLDVAPAEPPPSLADSASRQTPDLPDEPPGSEPSPFEPDWQYLPPGPETLPVESPESLSELTKLLSASARDLERLAHIREEQRRYDDADRLRRLAMQLRRENRRILAGQTPNSERSEPSVGVR